MVWQNKCHRHRTTREENVIIKETDASEIEVEITETKLAENQIATKTDQA